MKPATQIALVLAAMAAISLGGLIYCLCHHS